MAEERTFRKDLYFRLKVFQIRVPELKDRAEDVPALAGAALARWNERVEPHRRIGISERPSRSCRLRLARQCPRADDGHRVRVIVCEGGRILAHHLPEACVRAPWRALSSTGTAMRAVPRRIPRAEPPKRYVAPDADAEREAIVHALEEADGNRTRAAAALGMGRTTLWQKLKEYGI